MKKILLSIVFFLILNVSGFSQIARELKSTKVVQNESQDSDGLLSDYFQLSHKSYLLERGASTVYSGENLGAIQFPMGGVGTGCIQYNGKAVPRYWQIFNNMTHDYIPNSFFAIRVKNNQDVKVRALQTEDVCGFTGMKELEVESAFPFLTYNFKDELSANVKMEVFNPFIPTDLKNSEIPAVFYQFTIENPTSNEIEISLLASQQNAVGFSKIPKISEGDSFAARFEKSLKREAVQGNSSDFYGGNINTVYSESGKDILFMNGSANNEDEHFGQMALMHIGTNNKIKTEAAASWTDEAKLLQYFTETGKIETNKKTKPSKENETWSGALNVPFVLKPGETRVVNMALAWYFPNGLNGGHTDSWDAWGKGEWVGLGNNYANYWKDITDLTNYIIEKYDWLHATSKQFTESFNQTNLPTWLIERIGNQLAILKSRTLFHDKRGYVGLWEGCGSGDGSCAGNCNHVWHYAQAHARLFPGMARTIKEQSFNAIKDDGQIPYRQPAGSPSFDGQCGDIIGAYREHLLSVDDVWLKVIYPSVKKAMNYLIDKHDKDKDGWLSDLPKHTTYDASMTGNPSFLSSLYLTALKSSAEMAHIEGDSNQAELWGAIAINSMKLQNDSLWNGEYFFQLPGEKRATDYENGCLSDQLLGQWWADQLGFGSIYPDYRIHSATKAILKYNFKSNFENHKQLARKFAKPDEAGIVATTWPGNDRTSYASGYSDEVWTTYEYTIGSTLLKYGELRDAMTLLRSGFDRYNGILKTGYKTDNGWGNFGFSGNPFGDDECGQFYGRALSIWSVLLAVQGFEYNGPQGKIGFNPKWKPENHNSFFSTAEGWGNFTQEKETELQKNMLEIAFGKLKLEEISIPAFTSENNSKIMVILNGNEIEFSSQIISGNLELSFNPIVLEKGDKFKIIQNQ